MGEEFIFGGKHGLKRIDFPFVVKYGECHLCKSQEKVLYIYLEDNDIRLCLPCIQQEFDISSECEQFKKDSF